MIARDRRIRLVAGNELVGDWDLAQIGIATVEDGFNIRAEGEEFVLRTEDDAAFAGEIGIAAASPRLARRLAARTGPGEASSAHESSPMPSNLAAIGFALAGALVVLGGTLLSGSEEIVSPMAPAAESLGGDPFRFWLAFVVGGVLMIGAAYVMSMGARWGRLVATFVLVGVVVVFGLAVSSIDVGADELTAYGFVAGGLVVGVAVIFSGSVARSTDG